MSSDFCQQKRKDFWFTRYNSNLVYSLNLYASFVLISGLKFVRSNLFHILFVFVHMTSFV